MGPPCSKPYAWSFAVSWTAECTCLALKSLQDLKHRHWPLLMLLFQSFSCTSRSSESSNAAFPNFKQVACLHLEWWKKAHWITKRQSPTFYRPVWTLSWACLAESLPFESILHCLGWRWEIFSIFLGFSLVFPLYLTSYYICFHPTNNSMVLKKVNIVG